MPREEALRFSVEGARGRAVGAPAHRSAKLNSHDAGGVVGRFFGVASSESQSAALLTFLAVQ